MVSPALMCLLLLELDHRHCVPSCVIPPPPHPHTTNLEGGPAPGEKAKWGNCAAGGDQARPPLRFLPRFGGWGVGLQLLLFLNQALGHLFTPCYALNCVPQNCYLDIPAPVPQEVTVFGDKHFTCMRARSLLSCQTLCNSMDCSPPGSSVHGILQARILEWVAMPSSRGSSQPRDRTMSPALAGMFFTTEPPALQR